MVTIGLHAAHELYPPSQLLEHLRLASMLELLSETKHKIGVTRDGMTCVRVPLEPRGVAILKNVAE